jgi:hypothetical protein
MILRERRDSGGVGVAHTGPDSPVAIELSPWPRRVPVATDFGRPGTSGTHVDGSGPDRSGEHRS